MTVEDKIKLMDIKEFRDEGFLQEVNRKFFNPLGLAMVTATDQDGNVIIAGIWDYREDSEGIFFSEDIINEDKAANIEKLRKSKLAARKAMMENHPAVVINSFGIQTK